MLYYVVVTLWGQVLLPDYSIQQNWVTVKTSSNAWNLQTPCNNGAGEIDVEWDAFRGVTQYSNWYNVMKYMQYLLL